MTEQVGAESLAVEITSGVDFAQAFGEKSYAYKSWVLMSKRDSRPPEFQPTAVESNHEMRDNCKQNAKTLLDAVSGKDLLEKSANLHQLDSKVTYSGGDLFTTVSYLVFPDNQYLRQELDSGLREAAGQALDRALLNRLNIFDLFI